MIILFAELIYFSAVSFTDDISGEAFLASLKKVFAPLIIKVLSNVFFTADRGNGLFASSC
jgi:hypothetical protein